MRILISYFFGIDTIPLGGSCSRAFETLGHKVYCFNSGIDSPIDRFFFKPVNKLCWNIGMKGLDISRGSKWNNQEYRQRLLEDAVKRFEPVMLFIIRGHGFDGEFLKYLKRKYAIEKLLGWWVKGPKWTDLMLAESAFYDHYFCIHEEHNIKKIKCLKGIGIDNYLYRRLKLTDREYKVYLHEIVFVGGWSPRRQNIMERIADCPVSIWGHGWRKKNLFRPLRKNIKGYEIYGEPLLKLYNASSIVLNISNWNTGYSGLNLRIFDVPACGTFLLTEYSEELVEHFEVGREIETFKDSLELRDKLTYYLKHDIKREKIARNGYEKVMKSHTYKNKMLQLLKLIGS